jgi:hypothetical protein
MVGGEKALGWDACSTGTKPIITPVPGKGAAQSEARHTTLHQQHRLYQREGRTKVGGENALPRGAPSAIPVQALF